MKPPPNTSLEFVETVGRLYYQSGAHKNLAEKKIAYFYDHLRSQFHLKTFEPKEAVVERLAEATRLGRGRLHDLFARIEAVQASERISSAELMALHRSIEEFYGETK